MKSPRFVVFVQIFALGFALLATSNSTASEVIPSDKDKTADGVSWYDIRLLEVEGQGWKETKAPFDRLPATAEKEVRAAVWNLSRHSAGICARFSTSATEISARWTLTSSRLAMPHMAATGVSGLDLYVKHEGKWRWLATGFPREQSNVAKLISGIPRGKREYLLYLPLYNGVSSVEIGLPEKDAMETAPSRGDAKPIVFYGTSITQGGCASRPGMVHTAILGRWLDRPVINLGFSGNGRMEAELARLMAQLDAAVYVIDCLPNINAKDVGSRTEPLIKILRAARPDTPILLVEDRNYTDSFLVTGKRVRNETSQQALRAVFEKLTGDDANLHYLRGGHLLGDDNEGTVDSSHPTDLGFLRQAAAFRVALEPLLKSR
ncbi:MAG: SGNH/GDSL hydrolase family protein [Pirellulaceae bacterium]|jgi:hypothetical protein|nr:SGNH/GDSL hydrolase family protein [Pirellulaceae bacterium]MDP7020047.1 SGNH/GDSL hydrolase family protein [Pirellulaceae bacterium]